MPQKSNPNLLACSFIKRVRVCLLEFRIVKLNKQMYECGLRLSKTREMQKIRALTII